MKNDQREKRRKIIMEGNRGKPKSNYFRKLFVLLFAKFLTLFYAALPFFHCSYCRRPSVKVMAHFSHLQAPFRIS